MLLVHHSLSALQSTTQKKNLCNYTQSLKTLTTIIQLIFNRAAYLFMSELDEASRHSREFYTHSFDEFCGKNLPTTITNAHVRILLDPDFQYNSSTQVIPLLPNVQEELMAFVEGYSEREHLIEERKESWLPIYVQPLI